MARADIGLIGLGVMFELVLAKPRYVSGGRREQSANVERRGSMLDLSHLELSSWRPDGSFAIGA